MGDLLEAGVENNYRLIECGERQASLSKVCK